MFVFSGLKPWPNCVEEMSPVTWLHCLLFHSLYDVLPWAVMCFKPCACPTPAIPEWWADGNTVLTECHVQLSTRHPHGFHSSADTNDASPQPFEVVVSHTSQNWKLRDSCGKRLAHSPLGQGREIWLQKGFSKAFQVWAAAKIHKGKAV